ncbi:MerR family transcriptional regulator [Microbulbifer thermotolerans]|uniref:MerR family transcriptional regulator n=1 Tax=Microbulbifer thermotolerans TaxID=252514 RepID=A0AB35HUS7_MICTH|nr:MerR family transcriptional regulator [Microbulbifer thermotolerans]MCX2778773.1 MerR family transcriptional regulator [Microbulbifer thermotolerans]MCX2800843.1 MerR family transcriptional regulator [Microbulbifer thermotolerans]MCX2804078.1 MerR family transcriptional regulator [Microbulbifer thermotolerans]MCX2834789.1 MerR family transcriptional regulator [Microbulbifer thermotolerans]
MNISQAAQRSGLTAKALRYYESIHLLSPKRAGNGYRDYSERDLETLHFIRRARAVGFTVDEVRNLLVLHHNPSRRSHDAKALVEEKLTHIDAQLRDLREMRGALRRLADSCAGDESPECSILDSLCGGVCDG